MALAVVAAIVGAVGAASSLGATAYSLSGADQPNPPNEAASSAGMARTSAGLLPIQRGLAAAAQTGGSYTFSLPDGIGPGALGIKGKNPVGVPANLQKLFPEMTGSPGSLTMDGVPVTRNSDGSYTVNFSGYGTAQAGAVEAQQNAANQLAIQQQYDPQFIATALAQEAQADPASVAARAEMNTLTQQQANAPLNEPGSTMLNSQISDMVNAAKNNTLTATDTARLNAAVSDALGSRGGSGPRANFEEPLTTGFAGEQRQAQAAQAGEGFLASGSDPEDIEYRRTQQNLANLGAEATGQTPSSEFASLSGASNGPAQMAQGGALPLPGDNGAAAQQIGMQNWQTQMQNMNNQVNPWLAGTSSLLQLGSAITPRPSVTMPTLLTPSNPAS